jgi:hypothetical protein
MKIGIGVVRVPIQSPELVADLGRTTNIRVDCSAYVERSKQASSTSPISFFLANSS